MYFWTNKCMWGGQRKPNILHKTHSSQKLATLLLRIDTAIYRVGDLHSENSQIHTVVSLLLWGEHSVKCVRPALKMEASKEEKRGVVRFLVAEGACLLCMANTVCPWQVCTSGKRDSAKDAHLCKTIRTHWAIVRIDDLIWENWWITEEQIRVQVGISHGSVHVIIKDHLQFQKICTQWVSH